MQRLLSHCPRPGPRFGAISAAIHVLRSGKCMKRRTVNKSRHCFTVTSVASFHERSLSRIINGCFGGSCHGTISSLIRSRGVSISRLHRVVSVVRGHGGGWACKAVAFVYSSVERCVFVRMYSVWKIIIGQRPIPFRSYRASSGVYTINYHSIIWCTITVNEEANGTYGHCYRQLYPHIYHSGGVKADHDAIFSITYGSVSLSSEGNVYNSGRCFRFSIASRSGCGEKRGRAK